LTTEQKRVKYNSQSHILYNSAIQIENKAPKGNVMTINRAINYLVYADFRLRPEGVSAPRWRAIVVHINRNYLDNSLINLQDLEG